MSRQARKVPKKPAAKTAKRPATKRRSKHADAGTAPVTVRHYCQGIGDCHLLAFNRDDGGKFYMLIDCGVHSAVAGGTDKIKEVVNDIASVTKFIDVLVVTHEHWDHLSGFVSAADEFAK